MTTIITNKTNSNISVIVAGTYRHMHTHTDIGNDTKKTFLAIKIK